MSLPEAFRIGRPRPPHTPRTIQCVSCGAPQSVVDERTAQLVCRSCNSQLTLTDTEVKVLRHRGAAPRKLELELDAPFTWRGAQYRVMARMVWSEPDDEDTVAYYLYSPRHPPLWLECYEKEWVLYHDTHLQPEEDPFANRTLHTGDGRRWTRLEEGTTRLAYVDGALPWVATVGETSRYVSFIGENDRIFDAERVGDELEYALAERLDAARLARATGKSLPANTHVRNVSDWVQATPAFPLMMVAAIAAMWCGMLYSYATTAGRDVLEQGVSAAALREEVLTRSFELDHPDTVIQVSFTAGDLENAWMVVDWALVKDTTTVVHVDDLDLEYFHGYEGGESWSEGSQTESALLRVPEAGTYELLVHAASGEGETTIPDTNAYPLFVTVRADALPRGWGLAGLVISATTALLFYAWYRQQKAP